MHLKEDYENVNMVDISEEHGKQLDQDIYISTMERKYQGEWDCNMMGDYTWGLIRVTYHIIDEKYEKLFI